MPPSTDNGAARPGAAPRPRASTKYENLTPLEAALVDQIGESNDRVVASIDRLTNRAPHPALVWGIGAVIAVYVVTLIAGGSGVDVSEAADATVKVVGALPVVEEPAAPTKSQPAVEESPPAAGTENSGG